MIRRNRKNYTSEFKSEAVKLVTEQGYRVTEAARNLDVHDSVLRRWIKAADPEARRSFEAVRDVPVLTSRELQAEAGERYSKKGGSLLRERVGLRFEFIDSVKKAYSISLLCKVMHVSRNGYYKWRKRGPSARTQERDRFVLAWSSKSGHIAVTKRVSAMVKAAAATRDAGGRKSQSAR
ncbi:MAG: transposase [Desulfocapsaceae bacterium]|nr:transposase [Desulfocapsaceae bacterium]